MKAAKLFKEFLNSEKAGGLILIACTIISLIISNSSFSSAYHHFWSTPVLGNDIEYWINDGLMAIFFLLIGLELKREIYIGKLSTIKNALFLLFGAIGGMLFPFLLFLLFNYGTPTQSGAGIPMATDIAFALGILSLLGNKVPVSLKIFLTALAVIDDLGAIVVIAVFYTQELLLSNLLIASGVFCILLLFNLLGIKKLIPYILGGIIMWYFMLHSGVHATITGVLLAFAVPFNKGNLESASSVLQHFLHKPVAFIILPIFALANTAIHFEGDILKSFTETYSLGVSLGLIIGKPLGIFVLTFVAVKAGICKLPTDLLWKNILGVGFLGGIGFTMSIFITLLAFKDDLIINNTKLTILLSSLIAGGIGYLILKLTLDGKRPIS